MLRVTTQIGTTQQTRKHLVVKTKKNLEQVDIKVAYPKKEGLFAIQSPWAHYEEELGLFESIARASFHVAWNEDGEIDQNLGLQIMYAMVKERPIVIVRKPIFTPDVDAFTREIIMENLKTITIAKLDQMEPAELNYLLKNLPASVTRDISPRQATLIHSRVKGHFRELLTDAKSELRVQYA